MKHFLILIFFAIFVATNSSANFYNHSLAEPEEFWGSNVRETYDVAVFLPGDLYGGMNISEIKGFINATNGIDNYNNGKVWLSSKLEVEGTNIVPSICSAYATLSNNDNGIGEIYGELPEQYKIPLEGVYVGYSLDVTGLDKGTQKPIGVATNMDGDVNSFYLHTSKTYKQTWINFTDINNYSCAFVVKLEKEDILPECVDIKSIPKLVCNSQNETKSVPVLLSSTSANPISSVEFQFSLLGEKYSYVAELSEEVPAGIYNVFKVNLLIPAIQDKINESTNIELIKANGRNNNSINLSETVRIIDSEIAPKHQTLIEDFDAMWSYYSPRCIASIDNINKNFPEFIIASLHYGDELQIPSAPSDFGYPAAIFNRIIKADPYWGTRAPDWDNQDYNDFDFSVIEDVDSLNSEPTAWDISISHSWEDIENTQLTADVKVKNILGYTDEQYEIGYYLICDSLVDKDWIEQNIYYTYSPRYIPELNNFCKDGIYGERSVSGIEFNNIVISDNGYLGIKGSIPSTLSPDETVNHKMTWDISKIRPNLISNKENISIIAFVLNEQGEVLNCAKRKLTPIMPNDIHFTKDVIDASIGDEVTITPKLSPDDVTEKALIWSSSDAKVATAENGVLNCIGVGEAIITATTVNDLTATCTVRVSPIYVESITISPSTIEEVEGNSVQLSATVLPENATYKEVEWASDNESVATVDENGLVTVISENSTIIRAKATDGSGVEGICEVTGVSGVEQILADGKVWNLYSIEGVLIRKNIGTEEIKQLSPAVYILSDGHRSIKFIKD